MACELALGSHSAHLPSEMHRIGRTIMTLWVWVNHLISKLLNSISCNLYLLMSSSQRASTLFLPSSCSSQLDNEIDRKLFFLRV